MSSSVRDSSSVHHHEVNRLSSRPRDDATADARPSKSVSAINSDTRSFPAQPRTHATGSLPTFSGSAHATQSLPTFSCSNQAAGSLPMFSSSLQTGSIVASTPCAGETTHSDSSSKKPKVHLMVDDEFENDDDDDAAMLMMMAQRTEQENYTLSSSSSNSIVNNSRQTHANSRRNVLSSDSSLMNSSQAVNRGRQENVYRGTSSDSGINSSSMTCNVSGTRQFANTGKSVGFTNRDIAITMQPFTYLCIIMKTLSSSSADVKDSICNVKVTDV